MKKFTKKDVGCYIDGAFGEKHRREKLIELIEVFSGSENIIKHLKETPSDYYSEEIDAIDLLQENTEDGLVWILEIGDLLLVEDKEENY